MKSASLSSSSGQSNSVAIGSRARGTGRSACVRRTLSTMALTASRDRGRGSRWPASTLAAAHKGDVFAHHVGRRAPPRTRRGGRPGPASTGSAPPSESPMPCGTTATPRSPQRREGTRDSATGAGQRLGDHFGEAQSGQVGDEAGDLPAPADPDAVTLVTGAVWSTRSFSMRAWLIRRSRPRRNRHRRRRHRRRRHRHRRRRSRHRRWTSPYLDAAAPRRPRTTGSAAHRAGGTVQRDPHRAADQPVGGPGR